MSEIHREAYSRYAKLFAFQEQNVGNGVDEEAWIFQEREQIKLQVIQFLCTCHPKERFIHKEFSLIILQSASMKSFDPRKASGAFRTLENYIALLCLMPWKSEFHSLKVRVIICCYY